MKITLKWEQTEIEWDTSMCDSRVEVNQVARDLANGMLPIEVLQRYIKRNAHMMAFVCPVCVANGLADKPVPTDERQTGLFEEDG